MTIGEDFQKAPGIKEDELNRLGPCRVCKKPLLTPPVEPMFYRVRVERAIWDASAVNAQIGLAMQLGNNAALARAMGPDRDLAKIFAGPFDIVVHESCAANMRHLIELFPVAEEPETVEG